MIVPRMGFDEVPVGGCYERRGSVRKKVGDDLEARIGKAGRVKSKKVKGNPEVETSEACPLKFLGVGLRRHPEGVVEIGRKGRRE